MDNAAMIRRSLRHVWHPCTQMKLHEAQPPVPIARAEGVWLHDFEGRRYLDGVSSWWVNLFGHGHPHIKAALREQLDTLDHVMLAGFTHRAGGGSLRTAGRADRPGPCLLRQRRRQRHRDRAQDERPLLAQQRPAEKSRFIGLAGGYHGETVGALAVTDIAIFREAYAPLVRLAATVPSPDARGAQADESAEDVAHRAAAGLQAWLEQHHAQTAALIVEPMVQCAAGMAMHDAAYLREARAVRPLRGAPDLPTKSPPASAAPAPCLPTSRRAYGPISSASPKA
jgi:adenosylmethionine-8-amino-7-oxononanoate aminotransferase